MLLLLPHSMDLTVTSQFPSQTITPFRTLSSVVLPSSRITLSLLITVSAPLLCPHFSTWLTVILCGPNPAAIWLSSSSVWIIQPWITQLCCFWVPSPPQIQRRSPHFTSVTHTYGFTVGLVFTLNISPPLKCEISLFHHNIVFSHIPFSVILTSTYVTWSAPPIFTFFSIQFSFPVITSTTLLPMSSNATTHPFIMPPGKTPGEPNFALPWAYVLRSGRRKLQVLILPPHLDSQGCQKGRRLQLTKHCRTSSQSIPYPVFTSLSRGGSWLDLIPWQLKAVIWYRSRTPGPCLCVFNEEKLRN